MHPWLAAHGLVSLPGPYADGDSKDASSMKYPLGVAARRTDVPGDVDDADQVRSSTRPFHSEEPCVMGAVENKRDMPT
jgi:hypothetical protein